MNKTKQDVIELLNRLPEDCSFEDIQYHLYVLEKIRRGIEVANQKGALSQKQVEKKLKKWIIE